MERMTHESICGSFPVIGKRRDRGTLEPATGRITWRTHFGGAEDGCCQVFVTMILDGERAWAFVPSVVNLGREFIGRLGKYDREAHRELVSMLDWAETKGFDVRAADDPVVLATFGSFSFEGVRRDRGSVENAHGSISWTARPEKLSAATRCVSATMSFEGEDEVRGDGHFDGDFNADREFVGSLAECGGEARNLLVGRMGWNAGDGDFDVRPC